MKAIYVRRIDLLTEAEVIQGKAKLLEPQIKRLDAEYTEINLEGQAIQAKLEEVNSGISAQGRELLRKRYATADARASKVVAERQQLAAQYDELTAQMKANLAQSDALRLEFLELVDPFGALARGDREFAITAFGEWITLDGKNPGAFMARAFALWQIGELEKALRDFDAAVNLGGPMLPGALASRGGLLHALGRRKEANADFGKSLKLSKGEAMLYLFRGRTLCAEEKFASAGKDFRSAIRLNENDATAYRHMALLLAACPQDRFRNGKRAVENALRACELTKWSNWQCLDTLAAAYAEAGDFDEAVNWETKAADLATAEHRDECLKNLELYKDRKPLRIDWK